MFLLSKKVCVFGIKKKKTEKKRTLQIRHIYYYIKRDKKHDFLHVCNFNTKHKIFLNTLKYVLTPKIIIQNLEL